MGKNSLFQYYLYAQCFVTIHTIFCTFNAYHLAELCDSINGAVSPLLDHGLISNGGDVTFDETKL